MILMGNSCGFNIGNRVIGLPFSVITHMARKSSELLMEVNSFPHISNTVAPRNARNVGLVLDRWLIGGILLDIHVIRNDILWQMIRITCMTLYNKGLQLRFLDVHLILSVQLWSAWQCGMCSLVFLMSHVHPFSPFRQPSTPSSKLGNSTFTTLDILPVKTTTTTTTPPFSAGVFQPRRLPSIPGN